MPNINDFLSSVFSGATHPKGTMGDFQHAARLYGDNTYALTPKAGWMYYTFFVINPKAQTAISAGGSSAGSLLGTIGNLLGGANIKGVFANGKNQNLEAGMLVKGADLPKFTIQTEQLNQYNRHTNIQTKINYTPVSINFHDDMSNVTNELWQSYFRYYYADSTYASASSPTSDSTQNASNPAYGNTKYSATTSVPPNAYGLNNNQADPFFRAIIIYQLNRQVFNSYILVNPLVTAWDHTHLDQTQSNFAENKMTVQYETVFYGKGRVHRDNPPGFATFHYDTTPSPLSIQGGGTGTLFGPGGIISGVNEIFGGSDTGPTSILGSALAAANLANNVGKLNSAGLAAEGYSMLSGVLGTIGNKGNVPSGSPIGIGGGIVGSALSLFKGNNSSTNGQTPATAQNVVGGTGTDNPGGSTSQNPAANVPVAAIVPVNPSTLPTDSASLQDLQTQTAAAIDDMQNQIDTATAQQAKYQQAVASAQSAGGQAAVDALNAQYSSQGYQDPAKLQANLAILQSNQTAIGSALTTAQNTEQQPTNLAKDSDTQGPADPKVNVNPTNQEAGGANDVAVASAVPTDTSTNNFPVADTVA